MQDCMLIGEGYKVNLPASPSRSLGSVLAGPFNVLHLRDKEISRMVTIVPTSYYLDDWEKINASYKRYVSEHQQQITTLQEWLKKEPHLPALSNPSLGMFLTFGGGSTETAKESIDNYFTHKSRNPEMFTNRFPNLKRVEQTLDLVEIAAPEPWDKMLNGNRLTFIRLVDTDVSKLDFQLSMQIFTAALDFELARIGLIINGIIAVMDMSGFHLGYISKLNISVVAAVLKYSQILEKRVSAVHIINCNHLITQLMAVLRPFLSKDLANKLHFHTPSQMDEFFKCVPKDCVPSTYGGTYDSMPDLNEKFRKRFRAAEDWLKLVDSQEYATKENLRRTRVGSEEMNGSFRKLCID